MFLASLLLPSLPFFSSAPTRLPTPTSLPKGWEYLPNVFFAEYKGKPQQVGGVVVPAEEVLQFMEEKGYRDKLVFPIPLDPSGLKGEIFLQEVVCAVEGYRLGFLFQCPEGTKIVSPFGGPEIPFMENYTDWKESAFVEGKLVEVWSKEYYWFFLKQLIGLHLSVAPTNNEVGRLREVEKGEVLGEIRKSLIVSRENKQALRGEEGKEWQGFLQLGGGGVAFRELTSQDLLRHEGHLVFVKAK